MSAMGWQMKLVSVMRINCWNTLPKDVVEFALQYGFQIIRGLSCPKIYVYIINISIRERVVCDVPNSSHIHPGVTCQILRLAELVTTEPHMPIPDTAQHWKDLLL